MAVTNFERINQEFDFLNIESKIAGQKWARQRKIDFGILFQFSLIGAYARLAKRRGENMLPPTNLVASVVNFKAGRIEN